MNREFVTLVHFAAIGCAGGEVVVVRFTAIEWGPLGCGQHEERREALLIGALALFHHGIHQLSPALSESRRDELPPGMLHWPPRGRAMQHDTEIAPVLAWDLPRTDAAALRLINDPDPAVRAWMRGRLLREARPEAAVAALGAQVIADEIELLSPYLGRRRPFWRWLVERWQEAGRVR